MGRTLRSKTWEEFYSTGQHNLALDFYAPAIARASLIKRAIGYFSSTAYLLMYDEIANFLRDGGHLNLICSPRLSPDDIQTIHDSLTDQERIHDRVMEDLLAELDQLEASESGHMHRRLFGGMLRLGLVEMKIAITRHGQGIFHEKIGIIHDPEGNTLSFSGSANETLCGWGIQGNVESFDVFVDWEPSQASRVANHHRVFQDAWDDKRPGVQTFVLSDAVRQRLLENSPSDLETLERQLKAYRALNHKRLEQLRNAVNEAPLPPQDPDTWPSGRIAAVHQQDALDAWAVNGCRGIFKHATGSGKTFTGLHAVRKHVRSGGVALIIVPSRLLQVGWQAELRLEIPEASLLIAGDGQTRWKQPRRLEAFTRQGDPPHIILAIMNTASTPAFYRRLKGVENMLLVADEVHQLGSPSFSQLMQVPFGKRLGLSATPERYGDPEGTAALIDYFGGIVGPEFTLPDAVAAGRLVPYRYYPECVNLDADEQEAWDTLTNRIKVAAARSPRDQQGDVTLTPQLKMMLINRARIAKKAYSKVERTAKIVADHYSYGEHWLIYCEDQYQMNDVANRLTQMGLNPLQYHSSMQGDPDQTLHYFTRNGGILIAIRCLDEGVDIPCISHAVILASSQNPRQFIQRRGRVLRTFPGKCQADIWDILVMPATLSPDAQDSLTRAELARSLSFAEHALNQNIASELRLMAVDLGIDMDSIYSGAEEEDEQVGE